MCLVSYVRFTARQRADPLEIAGVLWSIIIHSFDSFPGARIFSNLVQAFVYIRAYQILPVYSSRRFESVESARKSSIGSTRTQFWNIPCANMMKEWTCRSSSIGISVSHNGAIMASDFSVIEKQWRGGKDLPSGTGWVFSPFDRTICSSTRPTISHKLSRVGCGTVRSFMG